MAPDRKVFNKAKQLFCKKWSPLAPDYIDYLNELWFDSHDNWFEGASYGPSTNNGLESTNRVIKDEDTLRSRLPLSQFVAVCLQIAKKWSESYFGPSPTVFASTPTIGLNDWTDAYHWIKLNKSILSVNKKNVTTHFVSTKDQNETFGDKQIKDVTVRRWKSFNEYKEKAFSVWIVVATDETDWKRWTCTCPPFLKLFKCKHIIGIAARQKLVQVPLAAKDTPINQKRRRGRPKMATKSLLVD